MNEFLLLAQNNQDGLHVIFKVVLIIFGFLLWMAPIFIAMKRGHPNAGAITALDLLLGWTFLGWVAALVWSFTAIEQRGNSEAPVTKIGSKIAGHVLAVIVGLILIMIGLLLSVPMVGLPIGFPIGLFGVLICLWGLFGTTTQKPVTPPHA